MKPPAAEIKEQAVLRRLYWWAFGVRAGLGLMAWTISSIFGLALIEDAGAYSSNAAELAQSWLSGVQPGWFVESMESGKEAWFIVALLACFYVLTGGVEAITVAILIQCFITAYTPILAYRAAKRLGLPPDGAMFTGRLVAFSPAFVFWAGSLYKEGVILFVLFLLVEHVLRLQQQFRPSSAAVLGLSLVAMFGLRFYIAAILCVTLVVGLTFGRRAGRGADPLATGVRQLVVVALLLVVFAALGLGQKVSNLAGGGLEESLAAINTSRKDLATVNSGYLPDTDVSTVEGAVAFFPVGLAYFLLVPLPWHFGSLRQNLVIAETLVWIVWIYPLAFRGAVRGARANPSGVLFLVLTTAAICSFYAIFVGNIGTAYRLRVQVWALWALLAGWGWATRRAAKANPVATRAAGMMRPASVPAAGASADN